MHRVFHSPLASCTKPRCLMSQPTGEHSYRVAAWWTSGRTGLAKSDSAPNAIHFTAPKEFGGLEGRWTPEELLLAAVAGCFTTTLRAVAGSGQFDFTDLQVEASGKIRIPVRLCFQRNCDTTHPEHCLLRGAGTCPRPSEESRKALPRLPCHRRTSEIRAQSRNYAACAFGLIFGAVRTTVRSSPSKK
jgi:hypothetical protein